MPTSTRRKRPFYGGLPAKPRSFSILRRRGGRPCPPAGKCPFSRKTDAKLQHFQWADVGIGPYDRQRKISRFCGRTESSAPTKARKKSYRSSKESPHFLFCAVGVDAYLGAKSRALRGCASKLACGRRIDPSHRPNGNAPARGRSDVIALGFDFAS